MHFALRFSGQLLETNLCSALFHSFALQPVKFLYRYILKLCLFKITFFFNLLFGKNKIKPVGKTLKIQYFSKEITENNKYGAQVRK